MRYGCDDVSCTEVVLAECKMEGNDAAGGAGADIRFTDVEARLTILNMPSASLDIGGGGAPVARVRQMAELARVSAGAFLVAPNVRKQPHQEQKRGCLAREVCGARRAPTRMLPLGHARSALRASPATATD